VSYITITQHGTGEYLMTLVDDGRIKVVGDTRAADEFRGNPQPTKATGQMERFAEFIGGSNFPMYWDISELHEGEPITAAGPLEFGDYDGHPFRGNQYTGAGGAKSPENLARAALSKRAGFTYHPISGVSPTKGWAIALPQNEEKHPSSVLQNREARTQVIRDYIDKHREEFAANPNLYLGGWNDPESKTLYLDTSIVEEDDAKAASLMAQYDQVAIYNLATGETQMNDDRAE